MKKFSALLITLLITGGSAIAGAIPQPGDFYLISRDKTGIFVGSHKLFMDQANGLTKVAYCDRNYFVRAQSVAWTQLESERGNTVRIEYNFGRGWRPICLEPENQVTLLDLGITTSAKDLLAGSDDEDAPKSRLSAIGAVFQAKGAKNGNSSFHTR
ncbi:MAG: hypothetical protein AAGA50_31135 [Pseudomonadota bacterium]